MKFAFFRADFLAIAERSIAPVKSFDLFGHPAHIFDVSIWYDSKLNRIKTQKNDTQYLFIEADGHLVQALCSTDIETSLPKVTKPMLNSFIEAKVADIKAPEAYNQRMKDKKQQRLDDDVKRKKEAEEREKSQVVAKNKQRVEALAGFNQGTPIDWDTFEYWLVEFGLELPIRTLGSARRHVIKLDNNRNMWTAGKTEIMKSRPLAYAIRDFIQIVKELDVEKLIRCYAATEGKIPSDPNHPEFIAYVKSIIEAAVSKALEPVDSH